MDETIVNEQADLIPSGEGAMTAVDEPIAPVAMTAVEEPVAPVAETVSDNGQPARVEAALPSNGADATSQGASLMEQFLSDPSHDYKTLKYGDVMDGVIAHIDREELLVDIGSKSEGIVPAREYSSLSSDEKKALNVGDSVLVFVVQPENPEGHAVVSIDRARQEKSWRRLQEIYEANDVIEAEVTNYNKGGLLVNLDGVRGFVPASQVSEIRGGDESSKQADMARLIGTSLPLKVIEINRHRNRLILSERQAIQERRDVMKERLIEELKEGEVRKGRVSSICDFGAFVDIGGADGLVHLSELSWSRVRHPAEVLKVGQEVDVYVLGINSQEKKIALSIKRTQAEPWSRVATKYEVGQLVRGTITQLANFGAFARIEDGIEGLIHVSELADERITHPKQVVREGQELLLRIIRIDPQRRRMGLSLRRALDTADDELVNVFGSEVLEERDRIVSTIREALEAEGIEPRPSRAARDQAAEATAGTDDAATTGGDQTATAEALQTTNDTSEAAPAAPQSRSAAFDQAQASAAAAESRSRPRPAPAPRPTAAPLDIPDELGGEPLSAIAIAFARAGGSDLVVEASSEDAEQPDTAATEPALTDEPLPAATDAAPAESTAVMEAGSTAPEAEFAPPSEAVTEPATAEATTNEAASPEALPDEGTTEAGGSIIGSIAGAVSNTVTSVAGAVAERVSGLADAIRPDGESSTDETDATDDTEPRPATDESVSSDDGGERPQ